MNTSTLDLLEQFVVTVPTFPMAIVALEDALRDARVSKAEAESEREALHFEQQERTFAAILALIQKPDHLSAARPGDEGLVSIS